MVKQINLSLLIGSLLLSLGGCDSFKGWWAREFYQGDLTEGIVRLSTQHLSMVTKEVAERFKGANVETTITTNPNEVGKGIVTKTIKNVVIDYPESTVVYKDCVETEAGWTGKAIVDATQTIRGTLTNNEINPVIPDNDAEATKLNISFKPENLQIIFTNQPDNYLQLNSGEISFTMYPRLATAQEQSSPTHRMRTAATSNTLYKDITFKNVTGTLFSKEVTTKFDIEDSNYFMQVGEGESGLENWLEGKITAFGQERTIPAKDNKLDPNYDPAKFIKTYSCRRDLKGVVEYSHMPFEEKIGGGIAALSMATMGILAGKFALEHKCGMASPKFLRTTIIDGTPADIGKTIATLPAPCEVKLDKVLTAPDCFGVAQEISGTALVTAAKKTMSGLLMVSHDEYQKAVEDYEKELATNPDIATAIAQKPEGAVPNVRQPVILEITADLSKITITEKCVDAHGSVDHKHHCSKAKSKDGIVFGLESGTAHAILKPVLGKGMVPKSPTEGICAVPNPIVEAQVTLTNVVTSLRRNGHEFHLRAQGSFNAVNGKIDALENYLGGSLKIGEVMLDFSRNKTPLNPFYEPKKFEDSYLHCRPNEFIIPQTDADCTL